MKYAIRREASHTCYPYLGEGVAYVPSLAEAKLYDSIPAAMPDLRDAAQSGDPVWVVGVEQVMQELELG